MYNTLMGSSIQDILKARKRNEPDEIAIIKDFVLGNFSHTPRIKITDTNIIITVSGAALAGALRPRLHELTRLCQTKKRLSIRIGS